MLKPIALSVSGLAFLLSASPALASFHLMKVEQAMGGVGGDPSQQAIQLRMRAAGQSFVGSAQARLKAWDAAGLNPVTLIIFPSDVANAAQGDRILVVSPAFAAAQPGIAADFVMTSLIPASYLAAGRLTFEDSIGTVYWSLAWGGAAYTGSNLGSTVNDADGNFGPPFGLPLPSTILQALLFSASDPTGAALSTNNLADYSIPTGPPATFTNNAGISVVIGAAVQFFSLTPCRLADTRNPPGPSGGPALQANTTRTFPVGGLCSVPTDARAVALIVTVVQETEVGDLRVYAAGGSVPMASAINFAANHAKANNAATPLGASGQIAVRCDMAPGSTGSTHFLVDVLGYFR